MERWHFALPPEFVRFLSLILQTRLVEEPDESSDQIIWKKLLQLVGGGPAVAQDPIPIHLRNGSNQPGEKPFTVKNLVEWQMSTWQNALPSTTSLYWKVRRFPLEPN
jgi:hypothetical protein